MPAAATSPHPPVSDPWDGYLPPAVAPARLYSALLGGKDHFPVDRAAAAEGIRVIPAMRAICQATRVFDTAAVFAAARAGITQFLDLGCGMPDEPDVHDTARAVKPAARVVYVDRDPMVGAHSRAMRADELTGFTRADILHPDRVLSSSAVTSLIDFTRPVMILMTAVLHWCTADILPAVEVYKQACVSGSRLVISHASTDGLAPGRYSRITAALGDGPARLRFRPVAEITALFAGWQLLGPGRLTDVRDWPAAVPAASLPSRRRLYVPAGVAVKR
jgi:hypothetical protein